VNLLKFRRLEERLTQKDLAEICGTNHILIVWAERGQFRPDDDLLTRLATALRVDHPTDLLAEVRIVEPATTTEAEA
jgi:transcriptional regulator with XRE-family HTH domain